jgi:ATP adenylyltransferase
MQSTKFNLSKLKLLFDINDPFIGYAKELRELISTKFKTSKHVLKSEIRDEFFIQDGISYLFKILIKNEFVKKSIEINKKEFFDPFAPPFEDDFILEEDFNNFSTHRLLFNKFPIVNEHVLLVTREFISQYTHMRIEEIENSILLMTLMDGLIFFNGGKNAGASQPRKHVQCFPMTALYNGSFGIFEVIRDDSCLSKIVDFEYHAFYEIGKFNEAGIKHLVCKFDKELIDVLRSSCYQNYKELSVVIFGIYLDMLKLLSLYENSEKIEKDYSFLMTHEWILVIPRKANIVQFDGCELNLNSAAYTLSLLIRSEEEKKVIMQKNILKDIFAEL